VITSILLLFDFLFLRFSVYSCNYNTTNHAGRISTGKQNLHESVQPRANLQ
jgi:hypothetical protein